MIELVLSLEFSRKLHFYHSYYWKWKSNSSFWNWSWLLRLYSIVRFSCQLYCSKLQQIWISLRSQPYLSAVQAPAQNNFCKKNWKYFAKNWKYFAKKIVQMFLCLCNWMMDLHIWLNAGLWKLPLIITTKLLISMKLISGSVMVFKSIEFHAKTLSTDNMAPQSLKEICIRYDAD